MPWFVFYSNPYGQKKNPQNIKFQSQNDNTQPDPEPKQFSNQHEPDLVSHDDKNHLINNSHYTKHKIIFEH